MSLLAIKENGKIDIKSPLILTVPELSKIVRRIRRSEGDHDGRKKERNRMELAYIFYIADWTKANHVAHYEIQERHNKACLLSGLGITFKPDQEIQEAINIYAKIQREFSVTSYSLITVKREMYQAAKLVNNLGEINKILSKTMKSLLDNLKELNSDTVGNSEQIKKNTLEVMNISNSIKDNIEQKIRLVTNINSSLELIEKMEEKVRSELDQGLRKVAKQLGNREDPNYRKRIFNDAT